jgi:Mg-chelatase subunit ChlD
MRLVGYYNPSVEYPALVVPILTSADGNLFAAYWTAGNARIEHLPAAFAYAAPQTIRRQTIGDFNPQRSGLFAFSQNDVVEYLREGERDYFKEVLRSTKLRGTSPFLRLQIAKKANDAQEFWRVLKNCFLELAPRDFSIRWLEEQIATARSDFFPYPDGLFSSDNTVAIGCLPGDEKLVLNLTRFFNDESGTYKVAVVTSQSAALDSESLELAGFIVEAYADSEDIDGTFLSLAEVVLAVDRRFAEKHSNLNSWTDVFVAGAADPDFRWIRPRPETPTGAMVEYALSLGVPDENVLRNLTDKVEQYAPTDHVAVHAAMSRNIGRVDALVLKRHSAEYLLRKMTRDEQEPLLISHDPKLYVACVLASLSSNMANIGVYRRFAQFCTTPAARGRLRGPGLEPRMAAAAAVASEARKLSAFQKPVAVCLLIDVSSSMAGAKLEEAKVALSAFLGQLNEGRGDAVGLISFSNRIDEIEIGLLDQRGDQIGRRISQLTAGGNTSLLDALVLGFNRIRTWAGHIQVIVVLTDGNDTSSQAVEEEVEALFRPTEKGWPILFGLAYGDDANYPILRRLTERSGGLALIGTIRNVQELYARIQTHL